MLTYLTRSQLIASYPVPKSRPGLRNWIKRNGFPAPRYLNCNAPVWSRGDVATWFDQRLRNHLDAVVDSRAA